MMMMMIVMMIIVMMMIVLLLLLMMNNSNDDNYPFVWCNKLPTDKRFCSVDCLAKYLLQHEGLHALTSDISSHVMTEIKTYYTKQKGNYHFHTLALHSGTCNVEIPFIILYLIRIITDCP